MHLAASSDPCGNNNLPAAIRQVIDEGWSGEGSDLSSRFAELDRMCNVYSRVIVAFNARCAGCTTMLLPVAARPMPLELWHG